MSTSESSLLGLVSQEFIIYLGLFLLIAGVLGGFLNIIVFSSLKTFRKSSCAFYLTAMSFSNIAHLIFNLIPYIIIYGYEIDWTSYSSSNCKFRFYSTQLWLLTSFTCMCLATIDQFLATCFNPYWHRWSNIKLARYVLIGFFLLWHFHGIPFIIYYNRIPLSTNSQEFICSNTNIIFAKYFTYGFVFIFMGTLPLTIMVLFGSLAYYNVRNLAYRTVPLVRRELDKQLTQMVLIQVIYNCLVLTPFVIITLIAFNLPINDQINFIRVFIVTIHNFYFASPFYIYVCVSKRFRQQFNHVLCHIHINRRRQINVVSNQALEELPKSSINDNEK